MELRAQRLLQGPIVSPRDLPGADGDNINGPSLILAPDWLPDRLGRFYLYFAHHRGQYIRLAYADALEGPWRIHEPGTLRLEDTVACEDHIASPDVHVDHDRRQIRMYFHGVSKGGGGAQLTYLATSRNGLEFKAEGGALTTFYLRVARWRDSWLGMAKGGLMFQSQTGTGDFRFLPSVPFPVSGPAANEPGDVRHIALRIVGDDLQVFFTRIGDRPEAIFSARIDLSEPEASWAARDEQLVLSPTAPYEGADEPLVASSAGAAISRENALRDPAIFEYDHRSYLLYSVAGEKGIALAEITPMAEPVKSETPPVTRAPYLYSVDAVVGADHSLDHAERIAFLSERGRLEAQLAALDQSMVNKRIFIMGCGRSGTWLLTALMSTYADTAVYPHEIPVQNFGLITTEGSTLVLKREWQSYQKIEEIPASINIAYIVRHPFDVLTSHNPISGLRFHIDPHRWLGEMLALQYLVDTQRGGTTIVRYEDLVANPKDVQARLASSFGLSVATSPDDVAQTFGASKEAVAAMHGLRSIDHSSVFRYRSDPEHLKHLRNIRPRLGRLLEWVGETFGYNISL
jgi:hypothetical protein